MEEENKNKDHKFLFWTLFIIISLSFISLLFYLNQNSSEIKELLPDILVSQKENATFITSDGANSGTVSTTCTAPTTIYSQSTSYEAGNKLLIGFLQITSTDTSTEDIVAGRLVFKSGTDNTKNISVNPMPITVSTVGLSTNYAFITNYTAPQNEIYNITACSSATAVSAEAKLLVLNNVTNWFVNSSSSQNIITNNNNATYLYTNFSEGKNIIIARVTVGGGTVVHTSFNARLMNSSGTVLDTLIRQSNVSATTSISKWNSIILMAYEPSGISNANYLININNTGQNYSYYIDMMAFQVNNAFINTSSSTSLPTGFQNFTTLHNVNLTRNFTLIGVSNFQDVDSGAESLSTFQIRKNLNIFMNKSEYLISPFGVNNGANAGSTGSIMAEDRTGTINTFANYTLLTNLSTTVWYGKGTLLAFDLKDEPVVAEGNTCTYSSGNWEITCSDNCVINSNVVMDTNSNLSIIGEGNILFSANVTGFKNYLVSGISSSQKCNVIFANGARLR